MLQDSFRLVLFDGLRHHVQDVVHDGSAKLKIVMRLDTLFSNRLRDALAVTAFELTCKQVAKPKRTNQLLVAL